MRKILPWDCPKIKECVGHTALTYYHKDTEREKGKFSSQKTEDEFK